MRDVRKGHLHLVTETSEKPRKRVVRRSRFSDAERHMLGVALKTLKEARFGHVASTRCGLGDARRNDSPSPLREDFEQHVGAYWLAQLLVRAIPPILQDCAVVEVHLQTENLGWHIG